MLWSVEVLASTSGLGPLAVPLSALAQDAAMGEQRALPYPRQRPSRCPTPAPTNCTPRLAEEEMLREEMGALSSELREVREARHVLQAVRNEAAQAIRAVSGITGPEGAVARELAAAGTASPAAAAVGGIPAPAEVLKRIEGLEQSVVEILVSGHCLHALACSRPGYGLLAWVAQGWPQVKGLKGTRGTRPRALHQAHRLLERASRGCLH